MFICKESQVRSVQGHVWITAGENGDIIADRAKIQSKWNEVKLIAGANISLSDALIFGANENSADVTITCNNNLNAVKLMAKTSSSVHINTNSNSGDYSTTNLTNARIGGHAVNIFSYKSNIILDGAIITNKSFNKYNGDFKLYAEPQSFSMNNTSITGANISDFTVYSNPQSLSNVINFSMQATKVQGSHVIMNINTQDAKFNLSSIEASQIRIKLENAGSHKADFTGTSFMAKTDVFEKNNDPVPAELSVELNGSPVSVIVKPLMLRDGQAQPLYINGVVAP